MSLELEHSRCRDRLFAWLDGDLDAASMQATQAHLDGCADCRAEQRQAERLNLLCTTQQEDAAPAGFTTAVMARVAPPRKRAWLFLGVLATAAALLLMWLPWRATPPMRLSDGTPQVSHSGTWIPTQPGQSVPPGSVMRTTSHEALLTLATGALVRIDPRSEAIAASDRIWLRQGSVRIVEHGAPVTVETAFATFVPTGTIFDVTVTAQGATLDVVEGTVEVHQAAAPTRICSTGAHVVVGTVAPQIHLDIPVPHLDVPTIAPPRIDAPSLPSPRVDFTPEPPTALPSIVIPSSTPITAPTLAIPPVPAPTLSVPTPNAAPTLSLPPAATPTLSLPPAHSGGPAIPPITLPPAPTTHPPVSVPPVRLPPIKIPTPGGIHLPGLPR